MQVLQLDMYVMGKCPWCGKALQELEEKINCKFTCQQYGKTVEGQLDFRLHMVGLNDGSYEEPNLNVFDVPPPHLPPHPPAPPGSLLTWNRRSMERQSWRGRNWSSAPDNIMHVTTNT